MYNFFPKIDYKIDDYDTITFVDITVYAKIKDYISKLKYIQPRPYVIQNGERPDVVSYKLYGNPNYAYIFLVINDITNIYEQWPRDYTTFKNYLIKKYGSLSFTKNTIKYYYTGDRVIVSQQYWNSLSDSKKYRETIYEYESRLNDKKAEIKVMDFSLIIKFETDLQEILNNNVE
jgi:hypothetical protein